MIYLVDNYDSFTFNLYQYIEELGFDCQVYRNDRIALEQVKKFRPDCIVISPGPGKPSSAGISLDLVRTFAGKLPILGVCLGHQTIGEAFGGNVIRAPRLMHGKTSSIFHTDKGAYRGLPNPFAATRYHSLVVDRETLPRCFRVTSETSDGLLMGIRHKRFPIEGVQFHPESVMTSHGKKFLENFLKEVL